MVAHVFISGFVQGVGFRQFIKKSAERTRLMGWVKNRKDNRVEAVFKGSEEQINKIISLCRKGPFLSEVKNVEVIWEKNPQDDGEIFEGFEIIM